jgi:ADP-dependent NAD(P)H-hydrate dehydratase / NAD(P)H-hydrate epimerase
MKLLTTAEEMRSFDKFAIDRLGIPGAVLMENAGRICADTLAETLGDPAGKQVVVVCGKGNNGGDGFVVARHLLNRGARVDVLLTAPTSQLAGDAATNFGILRRLKRMSEGMLRLIRIAHGTSLKPYGEADVVVDALFGTGFAGSPKGIADRMIRWINDHPGKVLAVDIASGISATTGEALGSAVQADVTVTMAAPKIGHFVGSGRVASGKVRIADIGIPASVMKPSKHPAFLVEREDVKKLLPPRPFNAHKYSVGKVLVVAGSRAFTGAPVLASLSALRTGAGAVVLCVPGSIHAMLVRKLTDVIVSPCAETTEGTFAYRAVEDLESRLSWADVVVLGPGLSRHEETDRLVHTVLEKTSCPVVLDADGLNAMSGHVRLLRSRKFPTILTPHTGELARLIGGESGSLDRYRVEAARNAARELNAIVVLKGAPTVTASGGCCVVNVSGNPGMATIGSGDVLSGVIAGLIGQHVQHFEAAYAAVYLHGRAGDLAADHFGERSILATDILAHVPAALKETMV